MTPRASLLVTLAGTMALAPSVGAQDLDLYAAVQAGAAIDALRPLLAERYGPDLEEDPLDQGLRPADDPDSPLRIIRIDQDVGLPALFFFCEGALTGFDAPVTMQEAFLFAQRAEGASGYFGLLADFYENWIDFVTEDEQLLIMMRPIEGNDLVSMRATWPVDSFRFMDFYRNCVPD